MVRRLIAQFQSRLASPILYFGSKGRLAKRIISLFPKHEAYVEPFGGGASVLLCKTPCQHETYNDIDSSLFNFFSVISNPSTFTSFQRRVALLPYCRQLHEEAEATYAQQTEPVEKAWRWFVMARQCFSGLIGKKWAYSRESQQYDLPTTVYQWLSAIKRLPEICERLRRVQIEHRDFRKILEKYDGKRYLAYCDPPYVQSLRRDGKYIHEMNNQDHRDLIDLAQGYKGSMILSGYRNAIYRKLEAKGWRRIDFAVKTSVIGGRIKSQVDTSRVESIWLNRKAQSERAT